MTSKEFISEHIEQLKEAYEEVSKLDLAEVKEDVTLELEYFEKVLKDLEVLEILKKYLKIEPTCYPYRYVYDEEKITLDIQKLNNLSSPSSYRGLASWINNDEFKKVKEWLENGKENK